MKATRNRSLTVEEIKELLDYYDVPEKERISLSKARNIKMLQHFQFSLVSLAGTSS